MAKIPVSIFWFRRDLRLEDNAGLYRALRSDHPVLPVFIFDPQILDDLTDETDHRVHFIWQEVNRLKSWLEKYNNSSLRIFYSRPLEVLKKLVNEYDVKFLFANRDYEPYARERDKEIYEFLEEKGIAFKAFKDQVIFDRSEVLKADGDPYVVYTPYSKAYKERLKDEDLASYDTPSHFGNFLKHEPFVNLSLEEMGFRAVDFDFPSRDFNKDIIKNYHNTRDFPAVEKGTTRLGLHLRFGTISVRKLARLAREVNTKFFNELIWRDFYHMILYHFPQTVTRSFRSEYDGIRWENNKDDFENWKAGKTGYALVDAGMRQLNESGYMHNRVRMLVASFLTKHLLIDWRWGEAYFAEKLLDYDQASNIGGWQWAAGSGVDAAPYFRIFNPYLQLEKFDKDLKYVKRWVPEYGTKDYPKPMVDHKFARDRALDRYKKGLGRN